MPPRHGESWPNTTHCREPGHYTDMMSVIQEGGDAMSTPSNVYMKLINKIIEAIKQEIEDDSSHNTSPKAQK